MKKIFICHMSLKDVFLLENKDFIERHLVKFSKIHNPQNYCSRIYEVS